jgi:ectoine hydroxylase-related dioxygenase (phytanoyl-CoA dioxygenase family)
MIKAPVLSDDERKNWDENGYLIIKNCLSDQEVDKLNESLSVLAENTKEWSDEKKAKNLSHSGNKSDLDIVGLPSLTDSVDFLMDHPNIFGKILSLMGPYIYIPRMEYLERYPSDNQLLRLHTDLGGSFRSIFPNSESLLLELKVQFYLADNDQPESGNFMMVPSSHRKKFPVEAEAIEDATRNAVPVLARKGDAVIFPWSLWHAVAPNKSPNVRKSIIARYAQLWMRPVDYEQPPIELAPRLTTRRQRLLGILPECKRQNDYYFPDFERQINSMFGEEWAEHPELYRYNGMLKPLKVLYDQK